MAENISARIAKDCLYRCSFRLASGSTYKGSDPTVTAEIDAQLFRYINTIRRVPDTPGARALELGAPPFLMSVLVRRFRRIDLEIAAYYKPDEFASPVTIEDEQSGERSLLAFERFNVEKDQFPYPDGSFDVVLCCELLEHLIFNPMHLLSEVHRVLKRSGRFILTTPNVIKIGNIVKLLRSENIYDSYFADSTYARHTREYTPQEVEHLLAFTGFAVVELTTENCLQRRLTWKGRLVNHGVALTSWLMDRRRLQRNAIGALRGDIIFAVAERSDRCGDGVAAPIIHGEKQSLLRQAEGFPSVL